MHVDSRNKRQIFLGDLPNKLLAFTTGYGTVLAEASAVCLEAQGHSCGVTLSVNGAFEDIIDIYWPPVTNQMRLCWKDTEYATEHGAYGIALLILNELAGLSVVERSRKGTGFDFWLGEKQETLFQNKVRLEVSGIRRGNEVDLNSRVKQKLRQTERSDGSTPAYVVVVLFSHPMSQVVTK